MSKYQIITAGALVVGILSAMTMAAGYPKLYSPYSFVVVIPALTASEFNLSTILFWALSLAPVLLLYFIWSIFFIKPPYKISNLQKVISALVVLLSIAYNLSSFNYGIKYQGNLHTYVIYAFNLCFVLGLLLIVWANSRKASLNSCAGFSILFFSWLGWVAFPWLGELI